MLQVHQNVAVQVPGALAFCSTFNVTLYTPDNEHLGESGDGATRAVRTAGVHGTGTGTGTGVTNSRSVTLSSVRRPDAKVPNKFK
jgi:hypothetical protein